MNALFQQIKDFYTRHRIIILVGLGFVLLMQICSQGAKVHRSDVPVAEEQYIEGGDSDIKPLAQIEQEQRRNDALPGSSSLLIMMVLVLVFYMGIKKGWFVKIMPSIVWISLQVKRNKSTGQRVLKIGVVNQTKESKTFQPPILIFGEPFKTGRKFRIKGGDGQDVFPLTLMPGTSHQLVINLDQFRNKAGIVKGYRWVKVEVADAGKVHKGLWKLIW